MAIGTKLQKIRTRTPYHWPEQLSKRSIKRLLGLELNTAEELFSATKMFELGLAYYLGFLEEESNIRYYPNVSFKDLLNYGKSNLYKAYKNFNCLPVRAVKKDTLRQGIAAAGMYGLIGEDKSIPEKVLIKVDKRTCLLNYKIADTLNQPAETSALTEAPLDVVRNLFSKPDINVGDTVFGNVKFIRYGRIQQISKGYENARRFIQERTPGLSSKNVKIVKSHKK